MRRHVTHKHPYLDATPRYSCASLLGCDATLLMRIPPWMRRHVTHAHPHLDAPPRHSCASLLGCAATSLMRIPPWMRRHVAHAHPSLDVPPRRSCASCLGCAATSLMRILPWMRRHVAHAHPALDAPPRRSCASHLDAPPPPTRYILILGCTAWRVLRSCVISVVFAVSPARADGASDAPRWPRARSGWLSCVVGLLTMFTNSNLLFWGASRRPFFVLNHWPG
jgi:hypothetical protein